MDALFAQLRTTAAGGNNEEARRDILDRLDKLQMDLQTPYETHIKFRVQFLAQFTCLRIAINLGIFRALASTDQPRATTTLAHNLSADPELLRRVLRQLASVDAINEAGKDEFTANDTTRTYLLPDWEGAIQHVFDAKLLQAMPDYLAETGYNNPTSTASPAQKVMGVEGPIFGHITSRSDLAQRITKIQSISVEAAGSWLDVFPMMDELKSWESSPDKVVFVDVGGAMFSGQQCERLRARYPDLQGRLVLEDLPDTLRRLGPVAGVETVAQNFFEPQSIQGAKFYYLREVLHDWSSDKCIEILSNLAKALHEHSVILIDEMVLPDVGCSWQAAGVDIAMMSIGGAERSRSDWNTLVQKAGLQISAIYTYCHRSYKSVIAVRQ